MPYKIYTYEDPYKLEKTDFWDEISVLPHFCGARTLVNGLKDVLGDNIKGLICTLDDLVSHEEVYKQWTENISLRVEQYSVLSRAFKWLHDKGKIDMPFYMALTQNQTHFLEALRLFKELDIKASAIDGSKGNIEQQLFVYLLKKAEGNPLFKFPDTPNQVKLKEVMCDLAEKEITDCRGPQREIKRCERASALTKKMNLTSVVIHGLHQFSPVQLRLILAMEKMGITIIFLFNYQKKYSKIYSSWNEIYGCFDVPFHHDTMVAEYQMPTMQNPSNALACAMGELCEGRESAGSSNLRKMNQLYNSVGLMEFANITEYAHFVSIHFDDAIRRYSDSRSVMERGNDVWNNTAVLNYLDEQVYSANRDVHTLLKIYYPEYAKDRHFLSYPIGQFFSAIYRLWDYEKQTIVFDPNAIKECLSSNVLSAAPGEILLRTFYNVEQVFENITTYEEFETEIAGKYIDNYNRIQKTAGSDRTLALKQLSVYNKYKVPEKDVLALIQAIREINEIASYLFAIDNSKEDFINFGMHFRKLEEFLKQKELSLANEQERALVTALQLRLDKIKPEQSTFSGTFRDLREGLYFYLKQKNDDEHDADWIVKNFEQIDGDILQSKRQFEHEQHKVYHFACVSDRDMNKTVNDQLPWPLTDEFIRIAYSPIDLQFQVYYTALGERSNFLRYALFYGLCFNRCDVRLSFVRQYGEETTEPYALLSILGLEPKAEVIHNSLKPTTFSVTVGQDKTRGIKYDPYQMMDMFLCPYKFFLDYVTESTPVVQGNFLYQKYYENLLIDAVWKKISNKPLQFAVQSLDKFLDQESSGFNDYFQFWKASERYDLKQRARNYLLHEVIEKSRGGYVAKYSKQHMQIRKLFGPAKYVVDISEIERRNPYEHFEALTVRNGLKKEYSLHKLPMSEKEALVDGLRDDAKIYLNQNQSKDKSAIPSDWCLYCTHRGNCMDSFLAGEFSVEPDASTHTRRAPGNKKRSRTDTPITGDGMYFAAASEPEEVLINSFADSSTGDMPIEINRTTVEETGTHTELFQETNGFENILKSIQDMVEGNSREIQKLKDEIATRRSQSEDTLKIEALLQEEEQKSRELSEKLLAVQNKLAVAEAENKTLSHTVEAQDALLDKRKALEFSSAELDELQQYTAIIVFDTCSIMNFPNLLDGVQDGELVVVPKDVNNELEHHKVAHYHDERKIKAQRAITAIFNYKRRFPLTYADALLDLVPDVYRANAGEKEQNDNKILAVAIRFRRFTQIPVVFITDDRSLANKASGEDIEVWTAEDFLNPPQQNADSVTNLDESDFDIKPEEIKIAEVARRSKAKEDFLKQKISPKTLHLEASQVSILQNNGVKTIEDFMAQTENSFSSMKVKKGMVFVTRFLKEQEAIKKIIDNL